jgi:hypothetical protein
MFQRLETAAEVKLPHKQPSALQYQETTIPTQVYTITIDSTGIHLPVYYFY